MSKNVNSYILPKWTDPAKPEEKIKATLPCMIVYWGANSVYWASKWSLEQPLKGTVMYKVRYKDKKVILRR